MADTSPYYFLLRTENFKPLVDVVRDLSSKIEENEVAMDRLTNHVDNELNFPSFPSDKIDIESIASELSCKHSDPLRNFLTQKYKLDDLSSKPSKTDQHASPRVNELRSDIRKLSIIKYANNRKINEMALLINDYESFIVEMVIPSLRNDIQQYRDFLKDNMEKVQLHKKLESTSQLWFKYVEFLQQISKINDVCEKLATLSDTNLDDDVCMSRKKLLFIEDLIAHSRSMQTRLK